MVISAIHRESLEWVRQPSRACIVKLKYNNNLTHGEATCQSCCYWHNLRTKCLRKCTEHNVELKCSVSPCRRTSDWWWGCQFCQSRWPMCSPESPRKAASAQWRFSSPSDVCPKPGRWWWQQEDLRDRRQTERKEKHKMQKQVIKVVILKEGVFYVCF